MTEYQLSAQLLSPPHGSTAMRTITSDRSRLQRMLDFEAALARAEAAVGVISASASGEIVDACQADHYDVSALVEAAIPSGNIAIAVVNALTAEVARRNKTAAGFVHWGASSHDVIDTALVLELRAAIDALLTDLELAIKGFTTLAGRHRRTLIAARSMMQQATPLSFGLKLAGYAAALARSRERLMRLRRDSLTLQFGGASGTLAALGPHGVDVAERLAALLDLQLPEAPWHSHRDRLAEIASNLGILAGTCGKIARDVALMMQAEVGEASEPDAINRGVSSTLPQMRHPVGCAAAISAAAIAPNLVATMLAAQAQEHERGLGGWQSEWTTLPSLALVTSAALDAVVRIAEGIEIDVERMRANLELSAGRVMSEAIVFALAEKMGRGEAYALVQELSRRSEEERKPIKEVMLADSRIKAQLSNVEVEKLFVPLTYQGSAQLLIDRLVFATQTRNIRRADLSRPLEAKPQAAAPAQPAAANGAAASPATPPQPVAPVVVTAEPAPPTPEPEPVASAPPTEPAVEARPMPVVAPPPAPAAPPPPQVVEPPPIVVSPRPAPPPVQPTLRVELARPATVAPFIVTVPPPPPIQRVAAEAPAIKARPAAVPTASPSPPMPPAPPTFSPAPPLSPAPTLAPQPIVSPPAPQTPVPVAAAPIASIQPQHAAEKAQPAFTPVQVAAPATAPAAPMPELQADSALSRVKPFVPPEPKPRPRITLDRPSFAEEAPSAFMDILSRADAEEQAAELAEDSKRKRS